jgi:hypothetical protein
MAKKSGKRRMGRYHRRMGSYRRGRGLKGFLDPVYTGSVSSMQVLIGAAVGTVGAGLVKYGLNNIKMKNKDGAEVGLLQEGSPVGFLAPVAPLLSGALAGTALYLVQKKSPTGQAHLVGAVSAGAALSVFDYLKNMESTKKYFADYVMVPRYGNYVMAPSYAGVIGNNPAQPFAPSYGVLGTNPMVSYDGVIASNPRLAAVTASAMGSMGDYDMMDAFSA